MILLHIMGAVIVLSGLVLFALDQFRGKSWSDSALSAWKVNVSGPPALVLIVFGSLLFALPFSPWLSDPADPSPPTVTTVDGFDDGFVGDLVLPPAPSGFEIYFDEGCGGVVVDWSGGDLSLVDGWWVSVEAYDMFGELVWWNELDSQAGLWFGNAPLLCYWDFAGEPGLVYWFWVYSYNGDGFSEDALFVEFADF